MSGVAALIVTVVAFPALLARTRGGRPPRPGPQLAALAPLAVVPAIAAVFIAATTAWWLAVLLALPAALLLAWQLPPPRPPDYRAAAGSCLSALPLSFRVFTVNTRGGWADPGEVLRTVRRHDVDVLAVQELSPPMLSRLAEVGLGEVLPSAHLDPRTGSAGRPVGTPAPGPTAAAAGPGRSDSPGPSRSEWRPVSGARCGACASSAQGARSSVAARTGAAGCGPGRCAMAAGSGR